MKTTEEELFEKSMLETRVDPESQELKAVDNRRNLALREAFRLGYRAALRFQAETFERMGD